MTSIKIVFVEFFGDKIKKDAKSFGGLKKMPTFVLSNDMVI